MTKNKSKTIKSTQGGRNKGVKPVSGEVRIIAGDFRGRKLPVLDIVGLRPTSDRVRETLFNWLQFDVAGATCLDVFAGSGALGFEALSRGAKHVTMLDIDRLNNRNLSQCGALLGLTNLEVVSTNALDYLAQCSTQMFDVVFIDPPFNQQLMQPTVDLLFEQNWVSDQSLLYLEQEKTASWPNLPAGWTVVKQKKTSQVSFGLFSKS